MTRFHLVTLFGDACEAYLSASILGRARGKKLIAVDYQNPRDFAERPAGNKKGWFYKRVDDKPYGGGPGMVMTALPMAKAIEKAIPKKSKSPIIVWFSPSGTPFTNKEADKLAKHSDIILVCGRYEGIDERAKKMAKTLAPVKTYAIGEATYTGGEVPAMAVVDAVSRRIPGVLGKDASVEERRAASSEVYTRPEVLTHKKKSYKVPKILMTGRHADIDKWRSAA
jgi:tRNA (guanine37-N1)-methyltransferase